MYAGYDKKVGKLKHFVRLGRLVGAMHENRVLILAFSLDCLVSNKDNSAILESLSASALSLLAKLVELWIPGKSNLGIKKFIQRIS